MYNKFKLSQKYLRYYFTASNGKGHGIHSPFVFDFITNVLNDKNRYPAYAVVEDLRQSLLKNSTELTVNDFGAGSAVDKTNRRSISSIAKNAAKPEKYGQLLYRMIQYYQPATVLELGTSLGITTSYISLANPGAEVITMEGAPAIATTALENFRLLKLENIKIIGGNFDTMLPQFINNQAFVDFVFIDGNHRMQPTLSYFNTVLAKTNQFSIIVFDDIHWSQEMEEAWFTIKNHVSVKCSIDLFFMGIVFFRNDFKEQQHFTIRF
ncbi:MAG: SAM-dependent methyltransferase [Chitinophagaceae bacterium]|nr:SAM-dependent methyltransferase [Chitinophagaceae bacterium]